jgi:hypothetical protein
MGVSPDNNKNLLIKELNFLQNTFSHPKEEWGDKKHKKIEKKFDQLSDFAKKEGGVFGEHFAQYEAEFKRFIDGHEGMDEKEMEKLISYFTQLQEDLNKSG